jgi:hypothetical protein
MKSEYASRYRSALPKATVGVKPSQFHHRRSAPDMLPATMVAIPTASTHRAPKRTTVTRTTVSLVRTPNVSAVHVDPYTPSGDASMHMSSTGISLSRTGRRSTPARPASSSALMNHQLLLARAQDALDLEREKTGRLSWSFLPQKRALIEARQSSNLSHLSAPCRTSTAKRRQPQRSHSGGKSREVLETHQSEALQLLDRIRESILEHESAKPIQRAGGAGKKRNIRNSTRRSAEGSRLRSALGADRLALVRNLRGEVVRSPERPRQDDPSPPTLSRAGDGPAVRREPHEHSPQRGVDTSRTHSSGSGFRRPRGSSEDRFDHLQRRYWEKSRDLLAEMDRLLGKVMH